MKNNTSVTCILICICSIVFAGLLYLPDLIGALSLLISLIAFLTLWIIIIINRTNLNIQDKHILCYLLLLIIIPIPRIEYNRFDTVELLKFIIPYSIALCILVQIAIKDNKTCLIKSKTSHYKEIKKYRIRKAFFRICVSILLVIYSWIWISSINIMFDFSEPIELNGIIENKIVTRNPYFLDFCYYHILYQDNEETKIISLPISYFRYNSLREGDQIIVVKKPGALNTQYYYINLS